MKKPVLLLLPIAVALFAQSTAITGLISTAGSNCSTATNCVILALPTGTGTIGVEMSGLTTGTVQFEGTVTGTVVTSVSCTPPGSSTAVTSATANGVWRCSVAGLSKSWVRASALSAGTPRVTIQSSPASVGSGGSSGGAATPTPITLNSADYGCIADRQTSSTISTANGSHLLNHPNVNTWVSGDVGKAIAINDPGSGGGDVLTTITSFVDAQNINVSATLSYTSSAVTVYWGTDNTTCITNALSALNATGGTLGFSVGAYFVIGQISVPNNGNSSKPLQSGMRITGSGASGDATGISGAWAVSGGTILDLRYTDSLGVNSGKIVTVGTGQLEIDHLELTDSGTDATPLIYDTSTMMKVHNVTFVGSGATSKAISSATNANPVVFTVVAAPVTGMVVTITGATSGWATANNNFVATKLSATTFSIPLNSTTFGALSGTLIYRTNQDAIILGGNTNTVGGLTLGAAFQGYGTVVRDNYFDWVGRVTYCRVFCDGVQFIGNNLGVHGAGVAVVELDGTASGGFADGNQFFGNLWEMGSGGVGYTYTYKLKVAVGNTFYDTVFDGQSGIVLGGYNLTTSSGNILGSIFNDVALTRITTSDNSYNNALVDGGGSRILLPAGSLTCANPFTDVGTMGLAVLGSGSDQLSICKNVNGTLTRTKVQTDGGYVVTAFDTEIAFDATTNKKFKVTLTADVTFTSLATPTTGDVLYFLLCQDSGGSHTFAWPSNFKNTTAVSGTASTCTLESFLFDGTNAYKVQ